MNIFKMLNELRSLSVEERSLLAYFYTEWNKTKINKKYWQPFILESARNMYNTYGMTYKFTIRILRSLENKGYITITDINKKKLIGIGPKLDFSETETETCLDEYDIDDVSPETTVCYPRDNGLLPQRQQSVTPETTEDDLSNMETNTLEAPNTIKTVNTVKPLDILSSNSCKHEFGSGKPPSSEPTVDEVKIDDLLNMDSVSTEQKVSDPYAKFKDMSFDEIENKIPATSSTKKKSVNQWKEFDAWIKSTFWHLFDGKEHQTNEYALAEALRKYHKLHKQYTKERLVEIKENIEKHIPIYFKYTDDSFTLSPYNYLLREHWTTAVNKNKNNKNVSSASYTANATKGSLFPNGIPTKD